MDRVLQHLREQDGVAIYLATTGAAAGLQQWLWAPPGASAWLAGSSFPYDTAMLVEFLGFDPAKYVCNKTAMYMAQEAFMRAVRTGKKQPIGLGVTCSVASLREHRGEHRVVGCVFSNDGCWMSDVVLPKGTGPDVRRRDGQLADQVGLELLAIATRMTFESSGPIEHVADELAKDYLYDHPAFLRDGKRGKHPEEGNIVFPGSFNPLHFGHRGIARETESYHEGRVFYTITSEGLHKPALRCKDILKRAAQFRYEGRELLITRGDPLFVDKVRQLPGRSFVMGADTAQRFLDHRWYNGRTLDDMLLECEQLGANFLVNDRTVDGKLLTINDIELPEKFKYLFLRTPGHFDISSTQLREQVV
jgi:nicotinic acid mononucleotide adenylyltransferase